MGFNGSFTNGNGRKLVAVMYHYVRDVAGSEFPRLKAMPVDAFRRQVANLAERYEMAGLASMLAFLKREYHPRRDLCLLTFDDGLADHYEAVTSILEERRIAGVFHIPTSCVDEGHVLPVHKSHFLMAFLGFPAYRELFLSTLRSHYPSPEVEADPALVKKTYRWDEPEVAAFKYLVNYQLRPEVREGVLRIVFEQTLGDERVLAKKIYLTWDQAREMQGRGMVVGGHTRTHPVLAHCSPERQRDEIEGCLAVLKQRVSAQPLWPFSCPFGRRQTYTEETVAWFRRAGYACAFNTETGAAFAGQGIYEIPRIDPKDIERNAQLTR